MALEVDVIGRNPGIFPFRGRDLDIRPIRAGSPPTITMCTKRPLEVKKVRLYFPWGAAVQARPARPPAVISKNMLQNLKRYFDQHMRPAGGASAEGAHHALQVATAALLIEVMRSDREFKDVEHHTVMAAITKRFELSAEETATLLRLADTEAQQATDYYQFTSLINKHFNAAQKEQVVEYMWQVAAADHEVDRFERTLVHKVADLLYVSRPAQIAARERALRAIGPKAEM